MVILRLRSILGTRTGFEDTSIAEKTRQSMETPENIPEQKEVIQNRPIWEEFAEPNSKLAVGLQTIHERDPQFNPKEFLNGAKYAYEMIIEAFEKSSQHDLRPLLSKKVFNDFVEAINQNLKTGHSDQKQLIQIRNAQIQTAELKNSIAIVSVKFTSEFIIVKQSNETFSNHNSNETIETIDVWTFERDIRSDDPNWKVTSTDSE